MTKQNQPLGPEQKKLLQTIEEQLRLRAQEQSELPWLGVSVCSEIESREKAREWLALNGNLFALANSGATRRERLAALKELTADFTELLTSRRLWSTLGAVAGGGLAGYIISRCFPGFELLPAYSVTISLTALGAISGGLASQWQYLREYYL